MAWLDGFARSSTIALLAIMAFVITRDFRRTPMATAAVAFFFTIAAHLVLTSPDYASVRGLDLVLQFGALAAPGAFMIFARALFDEGASVTWKDAAVVGGLVAVGLLRSTPAGSIGVGLYYTGSLAVVVFALGHVLRGLSSDLVEPRRQLRAFFVLASGVEILIVIVGEILLAGERPPRWIDEAKSLSALVLTFMFAAWFLAPRRELFEVGRPAASAPAKAPAPALDETRHGDRLLALMQVEKIYRQEGLTIARLARTLDLPEYRLRRVINHQLGYRNFNAFLNDFRIEDACVVLADPAQERLPILNLALDLGYGSPGPFNRAFRAKTGYTPTEYRRMRLGTSSPAA